MPTRAAEQIDAESARFWLARCSADVPVAELPSDGRRSKNAAPRTLIRRSRQVFENLAEQELLPMLCACWSALLYRYAGSSPIILGFGTESGVRPIQIVFEENTDFHAALAQASTEIEEAVKHPAGREAMRLPELDRRPFFRVVATTVDVAADYQMADLFCRLAPDPDGWALRLDFRGDLFSEATADRVIGHLNRLARALNLRPDASIDAIDYIGKNEREKLLNSFNDTAMDQNRSRTVVHVFEQGVRQSPDKIAVHFEDRPLSYDALNRAANRLAHFLRARRGIGPDDVIALMIASNERMPVILLGVLKAGAAYAPLDPDYPEARLRFMLRDSAAKLMIADEAYLDRFGEEPPCPILNEDPRGLEKYPEHDPDPRHGPANLMYLIYTSGSTGRPKGVMVEHGSFWNLMADILFNTDSDLSLVPEDRLSQFASLSFDVSVAEIFMALLARATLLPLRPQHKFDALYFADFLEQRRVTVTTLPPAFLRILDRSKVRVRMIITGGDSAYIDDVRYYSAHCHYVNSYGPTETTVGASYYRVTPDTDFSKPIPIGKPIANVKFYILDRRGALVPIGLPGEIVIAGACVGRGYRNLPEQTQNRFLGSPFEPGERMYRTGDLGRWLPDGNLEFLGREDDQVKVRGFRIECGEVALQLTAHPAIREAAVLAREDLNNVKALVAFLTADRSLEPEELKDFLREGLPRHAIPDLFVQLENLPLNSNGKIDRAKLAAMPLPDTVSDYEPPASPWESEIAASWETVLDGGRIGRWQNVFDLGVDSLKASHFAALFFREHRIKIPLKQVFARQTPAALATWVNNAAATDYTAIPRAPKLAAYPLSHAQKRLWLLDKVRDEQHAYNMSAVFMLRGRLDQAAFAKAFDDLIQRRESLRTVFPVIDGEPVQKILARVPFQIDTLDWSHEPDPDQRIEARASKLMGEPFDLATAPLFRAALARLGPDRRVFFFTMHHIISDGWSMSLLVRDIRDAYNALSRGETPSGAAAPVRYRDFAYYQVTSQADAAERDRAFWLARLAPPRPVLALPTDRARPARKTYQGRMIAMPFPPAMTEALRALSAKHGASLFMTLFACVQALMRRYSGQSDIVLGSIVAGRDHPELREVVGFFVNTLALRVVLPLTDSFSALLETVRTTVLDAYEHQEFPFDSLVDALGVEREMGRAPLTDVMVALQDRAFSVGTVTGMDGVSIHELPQPVRTSKFDLSFIFDETELGLTLNLHFSTDLFSRARIRRMTGHLNRLIEAVITGPETAVADLPLLTTEEKAQILAGWAEDAPVPATTETILDLWARQSEGLDHSALVYGPTVWSRAHLDKASDRYARGLIGRGLGPGDRVGLVMMRSPILAAAMLAVWKCGAAQVPIDPEYPAARIRTTLEDSRCQLVLTQDPALIPNGIPALDPGRLEETEGDLPLVAPPPDQDAYILYTSGSTGRPKGAPITHGGLSHTLAVAQSALAFDDETKMAVLSSPAFDIFLFELFVPLIAGGTAIMLEDADQVDHARIRLWLTRINSIHATPAVMREIVAAAETSPDRLDSIRLLCTGGERVPASLLRRMAARFPRAALNVLYGPTETTIIRAHHRLAPDEAHPDSAIGQELAGTGLFIMDPRLRPRPIGFPGEICIAGPGLGRGYLDAPSETADRFAPNPFGSGDRLYRTGDLGVRNESGFIRFMGRTDFQVKVRGYRIELGEIEAVARRHPAIADAVAIPLAGEPAPLALYFLSPDAKSETKIRAHLEENLPRHMTPTLLIRLERFPLTAHGKLDRSGLPDPRQQPATRTAILPRNPAETELLAIWRAVLGRDDIGVQDDFFLNGGDSIKAIQIASRLHRAGYGADMRHIFRTPTVAELAETLTRRRQTADQTPLTGPIPLTPVQRRFFEENAIAPGHHTQALLIRFEQAVDAETIAAILAKIQQHHDMARALFPRGPEGVGQTIPDTDQQVSLEIHDEDARRNIEDLIEARADRLQAEIDLATGPLMRAAFFHEADRGFLLWVFHHLVIDAVSWRVLIEDLDDLLMQYTDPDLLDLPPKTHSYRDWSHWLAGISDPVHADYWAEQETRPVDPVQADFPDGANLAGQEQSISFSLALDQTLALLGEARQAFATRPDDLLVAGVVSALNQVFGLKTIRIEMEGHGRDLGPENLDFSRTVGWFTNFFPVIFSIDAGMDPTSLIVAVKDAIRRIPGGGLGYGLWRHGRPAGEPSRATPSIAFNYLGQTDTDRNRETLSVVRTGLGRRRDPIATRVHELEITAMVEDGRLRLSFSFGARRFKTATIQKLADRCGTALNHIVSHCLAQPGPMATPGDFTYKELSLLTLQSLAARYDIQDLYPLSPLQEGMLFHARLEPRSNAYFQQVSYRWQAPLANHLIEMSLNRLFANHDILRTAFVQDGLVRPLQVALRQRAAAFCLIDASGLERQQQISFMKLLLVMDRDRSFDLARDPLLRVAVLKLAARDYRLVWSHHHILMDGWCLGPLHAQFHQIYTDLLNGREPRPSPARPYKDYISWLDQQNEREALDFWRSRLAGYEEAVGVPRQKQKQEQTYLPDRVRTCLDQELSARIQTAAATARVTANTLFRSAWGLLLARYNGRNDVVFGGIVSGRPSALTGVETMIGLFINNVPVRIRIGRSLAFLDLCRETLRDAVAAEPYHYLPLAEIQRTTPLNRALLDHIFLFDNYPLGDELRGGSARRGAAAISEIEVFEQTNYDFNISVEPAADGSFSLQIDYNRAVFDSEFMHRVAGHYRELLGEALKDMRQPAVRIGYMPVAERRRLIVSFNDTAATAPEHGSPVSLFERMVQQYPRKEAVIFEDRTMSYAELNGMANRLAHFLSQKYGIRPEDRIGLVLTRSEWLIITVLAVWKTGAAYIPIDPQYPADRLAYLIQDSASRLVLTDLAKFAGPAKSTVNLRAVRAQFEAYPESNPPARALPQNLAYVIYTSGSTGRPKGVMIERGSVVNLWLGAQTGYQLDYSPVLLQLASFSFDVFVEDMCRSLFLGGTLILCSEEDRFDPARILVLIQKHRVQLLDATPALLVPLLESIDEGACDVSSLRTVVFGADRCALEDYRRITVRLGDQVKIFNSYGTTETTVDSSCYCPENDYIPGADSPPIGRPMANQICHVAGPDLELVPASAPGELLIGGNSVARGYLNRPDLTAARFIPGENGSRRYRTGDRVRWMAATGSNAGLLEFLGRIDFQLKIRGFRIEPGEIENQLLAHPEVNDAAIIALSPHPDNPEKELVALWTGRESLADDPRDFLAHRLPNHMIPAHFIYLEAMPLSPNGKIDRKALAMIARERISGQRVHLPARDPLEAALVSIWESVLDRAPIGVSDNFFEIGGHSLKATRVQARIERDLGVQIPLRDLFALNTIEALAQSIGQRERRLTHPIQPVPTQPDYPASHAQRRMWALGATRTGRRAYNMPGGFLIDGDLDRDALARSFTALIARHESLRTVFIERDGELRQIIRKPEASGFAMGYRDARRLEPPPNSEALIRREYERDFDLARGPLFHAALRRLADRSYLLLVNMHHIVSDGWSIDIILREIGLLYRAHRQKRSAPLPPLTIQYKDYAVWSNRLLADGSLEPHRRFWRALFQDEPPALALPLDHDRTERRAVRGRALSFTLDQLQTETLNRIARDHDATLFMILTAVVKALLGQYAGQADIVLGTPIAGRPHADLEDQVGLFVNTLPIRTEFAGSVRFAELLERVRESVLTAFQHQAIPFDQIIDDLSLSWRPNRNPLFDVLVTLQNTGPNLGDSLALDELALKRCRTRENIAIFDLDWNFSETIDGLAVDLIFAAELFKARTIRAMTEHFCALIQKIIADPNTPLAEMRMASHPKTARPRSQKPDPHHFTPSGALNEREQKLIAIWREVLGQTHIGPLDNFFELGGHSLKAIQITARIRQQLRVTLGVADLFANPSIAELANVLAEAAPFAAFPIEKAARQTELDATHAQTRFWALERASRSHSVYNMPAALQLNGALNVPALEAALFTLIDRHERARRLDGIQ